MAPVITGVEGVIQCCSCVSTVLSEIPGIAVRLVIKVHVTHGASDASVYGVLQ